MTAFKDFVQTHQYCYNVIACHVIKGKWFIRNYTVEQFLADSSVIGQLFIKDSRDKA